MSCIYYIIRQQVRVVQTASSWCCWLAVDRPAFGVNLRILCVHCRVSSTCTGAPSRLVPQKTLETLLGSRHHDWALGVEPCFPESLTAALLACFGLSSGSVDGTICFVRSVVASRVRDSAGLSGTPQLQHWYSRNAVSCMPSLRKRKSVLQSDEAGKFLASSAPKMVK